MTSLWEGTSDRRVHFTDAQCEHLSLYKTLSSDRSKVSKLKLIDCNSSVIDRVFNIEWRTSFASFFGIHARVVSLNTGKQFFSALASKS